MKNRRVNILFIAWGVIGLLGFKIFRSDALM